MQDHREDLTRFSKMDRSQQLSEMRWWFHEQFVDPVEYCPYVSAEGGYVYIHGGPYDARTELSDFYDHVPTDVVDELVAELEAECSEWSGYPEDFYPEFDLLDSYQEYQRGSINVERLATEQSLDNDLRQYVRQLLWVNSISLMDAFLNQSFVYVLTHFPHALARYRDDGCFHTGKHVRCRPYREAASPKKIFSEQTFYPYKKWVKYDYELIGVPLNDEHTQFFKDAVDIRNDFVHRNGLDKDGNRVKVSHSALLELTTKINVFVEKTHDRLIKMYPNPVHKELQAGALTKFNIDDEW